MCRGFTQQVTYIIILDTFPSSGQCQRPECVRLHKEQMQKEVQQMVNHDQLIQDFESLTTDIDGMLGVLEDALHEHGDAASFEARKLLCDLFQVRMNIT